MADDTDGEGREMGRAKGCLRSRDIRPERHICLHRCPAARLCYLIVTAAAWSRACRGAKVARLIW